MALSVRTRFEVFKRDAFTCLYCGRKSPDVVLEVDHIVPVSAGGSDDAINLRTSCWDCNRGKSDKPLSEIVTGEDPHDRAVLLLERERQLQEYNTVLAAERARRDDDAWELWRYWQLERGFEKPEDLEKANRVDWNYLFHALKVCPKEQIREFMDAAILRGADRNMKYVGGCVRNWRYERMANHDVPTNVDI